MQRAEAAETELAATKNALAAAVLQQAKTGTAPGRGTKTKGKPLGMDSTPAFTPKRTRSSPGDERLAAPKKQKNADARPTNEVISSGKGDSPWREVRNRKDRNKKDSANTQKPIRRRKKGEAVIVKTSEDTYADVLRAMRTDPQLKEFGDDVQKIRRTQAGDMIFELKRDSKNRSSAYKELTERVMGEKVHVKAMCPEATLQCKDLDEITTEDEVRLAMRDQCNLEGVEMTVRLRRGPFGTQAASIKLPVDAANKAMTIGKIKVASSEVEAKMRALEEKQKQQYEKMEAEMQQRKKESDMQRAFEQQKMKLELQIRAEEEEMQRAWQTKMLQKKKEQIRRMKANQDSFELQMAATEKSLAELSSQKSKSAPKVVACTSKAGHFGKMEADHRKAVPELRPPGTTALKSAGLGESAGTLEAGQSEEVCSIRRHGGATLAIWKQHLVNPLLIKSLVAKLPDRAWLHYWRSRGETTLRTLSDFLMDIVKYNPPPSLEAASLSGKKSWKHGRTECTHTDKNKMEVLFRIVPVQLHCGGKTIPVQAFLDEGATVTLVKNKSSPTV
ncbi:uncharacterized protein LOC134290421 [Aedes albopictus]|uniref:Uncharacterized protein n=1 Tax=Aedes albopictus TaxID=7160 RepID=A0ABM1YZ78_AEDAL